MGQDIEMHELLRSVVEIHWALVLAKGRVLEYCEIQWKTGNGEEVIAFLETIRFGIFLLSFFVEDRRGEVLIPLAVDGYTALHNVFFGGVESVMVIFPDVVRENTVRIESGHAESVRVTTTILWLFALLDRAASGQC